VKPLTINVTENSSPRIVLALTTEDENGTKAPLDLTPATPIHLYIKADASSPDPAPTYSFPGQGIDILEPRTAGRIAVQFNASDVAVPGRRFYRVDVHIGTSVKPRAYGCLAVGNV
jgi:hypothetical protein